MVSSKSQESRFTAAPAPRPRVKRQVEQPFVPEQTSGLAS